MILTKGIAIRLAEFLTASDILACYNVCKQWNTVFSDMDTSNSIWMSVLVRERYSIDSTLMDSEGNAFVPNFKQLYILLKRMSYNLHHGISFVREHVGVTKFIRDLYTMRTGEVNPENMDIDKLAGRVYCSNDTMIYSERKARGENSRIFLYDARRLRLRRVIEPIKDLKRVYPELDVSNASVLFSELRGALSLYYVQVAFPFNPYKMENGPSNPPPHPVLDKSKEPAVPPHLSHIGRLGPETIPSSKRSPRTFVPDSLLPTFVKPGSVCNLNLPPLQVAELPILLEALKIVGSNVENTLEEILSAEQLAVLEKIRSRKGTAYIAEYSKLLSQVVPKGHLIDLPNPLHKKLRFSPFHFKGRLPKRNKSALANYKQRLNSDFLFISPHSFSAELQYKATPPPDDYYFEPELTLPRGHAFEVRLDSNIIRSLRPVPDDIFLQVRTAYNQYCYPDTFEALTRDCPNKHAQIIKAYEALKVKRAQIDAIFKSWKSDKLRPCGLSPFLGKSHQLESFFYAIGKALRSIKKGFILLNVTGEYSMMHLSEQTENVIRRIKHAEKMEVKVVEERKRFQKLHKEKKSLDNESTSSTDNDHLTDSDSTPSASSRFDYSEVSVDLRDRIGKVDNCKLKPVLEDEIPPVQSSDIDLSSCFSKQEKTAGKSERKNVGAAEQYDEEVFATPRSAVESQPPHTEADPSTQPPLSSSETLLLGETANATVDTSAAVEIAKKKKSKWKHFGYADGSEENLPVQSHRMMLFYDIATGNLLWHSSSPASATGLAYLNEHNHFCHKCGASGKTIGIASCVSKDLATKTSSIIFHNLWTGEQACRTGLLPCLSKDSGAFLNFNISKDDTGLTLVTYPVFNKWKCQRSTLEVFDLQQIYEVLAFQNLQTEIEAGTKSQCDMTAFLSKPRPGNLPPIDQILKNGGRSALINVNETWQVRELCLSSTRIFVVTALDIHCFDIAKYRGRSCGLPTASPDQADPNDPYDVRHPLAKPTAPLWKLSNLTTKKPLRNGYLDFSHYGSGILVFTTMQGMQVSVQMAWVGEDCNCLDCLPYSPEVDGPVDPIPFRCERGACVNKKRRVPWWRVCPDACVELVVPEIDNINDPEMLLGVVWLACGGRYVVCDFCRGGYYVFSTRTLDLVYRMRQPLPSGAILDEILEEASIGQYPDVRHLPSTVSRSLPINDFQCYKIYKDGLVEVHDFAKDPIDDKPLEYHVRGGLCHPDPCVNQHIEGKHSCSKCSSRVCKVEDSTRESADYPFDPLNAEFQKCLWENRKNARPFGMPERCLVYRRRVRVLDALKKEYSTKKDDDDQPQEAITQEELAGVMNEDDDDWSDAPDAVFSNEGESEDSELPFLNEQDGDDDEGSWDDEEEDGEAQQQALNVQHQQLLTNMVLQALNLPAGTNSPQINTLVQWLQDAAASGNTGAVPPTLGALFSQMPGNPLASVVLQQMQQGDLFEDEEDDFDVD
eukprot:GDKJ01047451.1.p1 GENE.GDKJ01047451.1~~GDKJ01047451.1.p1  ORF type:complete len:1463 (-),score=393.66 GDKJ01047451.1:132-4520(-)